MNNSTLLINVLENQRKLTKWYLKKIPLKDLDIRIKVDDKVLNSPLWIISHLIWTDYNIGLLPLGFKCEVPDWVNKVGFGSSGELPEGMPDTNSLIELFDSVHSQKLEFINSLDESILNAPYALTNLGFKNNYYALLHLARHEGVHCGGIATFCKLRGIKTV